MGAARIYVHVAAPTWYATLPAAIWCWKTTAARLRVGYMLQNRQVLKRVFRIFEQCDVRVTEDYRWLLEVLSISGADSTPTVVLLSQASTARLT